ncbi:type 2 periplasmic-binding domain-containing protein [Thalassospira povalilytica]|uniref:hypothetical protein n=1 Tax=Thalassospira povalilytica TaxID=732237 RepID=UPI001D17E5A7|nr:hypothetical protein [Thalassospira povalilytica]MCC4238915.1 hypothetical protein [Thalassospira povalilytica]
MTRDLNFRVFRACLFAIFVGLAGLSSLLVSSGARADEFCLRMAMPEVTRDAVGVEAYRRAMADAGLCIIPVSMPNARSVVAMRNGEVDGVFAGLDDFAEQVGRPLIRGDLPVGAVSGVLVVRDGDIKSLDDLTDQAVGIWLGSSWAEKLMAGYPNVMRCPAGPEMMQELMRAGRLDAMLINEFSLILTGGLPDGFVSIPVMELEVYTWLRAEFSDYLPLIEKGNQAYVDILKKWRKKAS